MPEASKHICSNCVSDEILSSEILGQGVRGTCGYCETPGPVISIEALSDRIGKAFLDHFERTPEGPPDNQIWELFDGFEREGDPPELLIQEAAGIGEQAVNDVIGILVDHYADPASEEESDFSDDSLYAIRPAEGDRWKREWVEFVEEIKQPAGRGGSTIGLCWP